MNVMADDLDAGVEGLLDVLLAEIAAFLAKQAEFVRLYGP